MCAVGSSVMFLGGTSERARSSDTILYRHAFRHLIATYSLSSNVKQNFFVSIWVLSIWVPFRADTPCLMGIPCIHFRYSRQVSAFAFKELKVIEA